MSTLPDSIERYLLETLLLGRHWGFVEVDRHGRTCGTGGDLAWFGLGDVDEGDPIAERFEFLQGSRTPESGQPEVLPRIELVPGRATDVHLVRRPDGAFLLLQDVTEEARREQRFQQKGNEWSLVLRAWGLAVLELDEDVGFRLVGLAPPWMRALGCRAEELENVAERFPFLEGFLDDAQPTWERHGPAVAWSGIWVEEDDRGKEWYLEASATVLDDGRKILVIQSADRRYAERHHILQEARTRNLDFQRLRSEIDKKETLLHCIIHDLNGPLSSMVGSMSLIKSRDLDPARTRELLELGLEQAHHQESMIRSILDAFVADVESLEHFESDAQTAPDLVACVRNAVETYAPAFEQEGVALELEALERESPSKVCGEESRLERVLCNILENALRHSPRLSRVGVRIEERDEGLRVSIEDQGSGVPPEMEQDLFRKFAQGRMRSGTSGLGLYFCRSTVETWGGSIGYERIPEGGSRFWIQLPRAI